jgi:CRP-like cAMP-binding protein
MVRPGPPDFRAPFIGDEQVANRILLALPPAVLKQVLPHLKHVDFQRGHIVYRPGDLVRDVYFINRGLLSLVKTMRDGRTVEVSTRGIEGVTAPGVLFDLETAILECVVQIPASAFSIRVDILRSVMAKSRALNTLLLGYVYVAADQLAQTAACNRLHSLEERCCRSLLVAHDSARSDTFPVTQEFLAAMLGVQRPGVSITIGILQKADFIHCSRGSVTIINRGGLEASACECYRVIRDQFDRLFARRAGKPVQGSQR